MSILSDARSGKITWLQAAGEVVQWGEKLIAGNPTMANSVAEVVSIVKQGASDAVGMVDSAFAGFVTPAAKGIEIAADAALAGYTKGLSTPFNGVINDVIDKIASALIAEVHAWSLKAKANWTGPGVATITPPAVSPPPPPQPGN